MNTTDNEKVIKFKELYSKNVNNLVEKRKSGSEELTYLSWSKAWKEFKIYYPNATYEIKKFPDGDKYLPYMHDKNTGYMVSTEITADDITYEMWLPVMNGNNKPMKDEMYQYTTKYGTKEVEPASMFDVNKAIMRCLVKNMAMFGLGLYIYEGEDLPEEIEYRTIQNSPKEEEGTIELSQNDLPDNASYEEVLFFIDNSVSLKVLNEVYEKYKDMINDNKGLLDEIIKKGKELD